MGIEVIRSGLLVSIQDLGRYGYQKFGIPVSGVMDEIAAKAANILVGNDENEAVLEITLTGASFRMTEEHLISICGANLSAKVNGTLIPLWQPFIVSKGDVMTFDTYVDGCRAYVAVAGGIDAEPVLGSRSTHVRSGLGGLQGRGLLKGDFIPIKCMTGQPISNGISQYIKQYKGLNFHARHFAYAKQKPYPIRVIEGPEFELLAPQSKEMMTDRSWKIGFQSDRMGYRFEGESLVFQVKQEMITEGVVLGTIQLPPNGQPIVLLSDRQTTGGYPRIAIVASVDISIFGQLKPGDEVQFTLITLEEAEKLWLASERDLEMLKAAVSLKSKL